MKKIPLLLVGLSFIPNLGLLQAAETPESQPKLEFRLVVEQSGAETEALQLKGKLGSMEKEKTLFTRKAADFGGEDLKSVTTVSSKNSKIDPTGKGLVTESTAIAVTLSKSAGERMGVWSKGHLGERLAIVLDGQILMAPTVQSPLGAHFMIEGNFSSSEAKAIVKKLTTKKPSQPTPTQ